VICDECSETLKCVVTTEEGISLTNLVIVTVVRYHSLLNRHF
jgi:hypothetical protein